MLRISLGKGEDFRYLQQWMAASAELDFIIEGTEGDGGQRPPQAATDNALSRPVGSLSIGTNMKGTRNTPQPLFPTASLGRSTMWVDPYVAEKLRELDQERLAGIRRVELGTVKTRRRSVFSRLAAVTGASMRRSGEALELWATPASERETMRVCLVRTRRSD